MGNETGIRQLLVEIVKECIELPTVEEGVIVKEKPLTITLSKDKKMSYSDDELIIPERMRTSLQKGNKVNLLFINDGSICYVLDLV